MRVLVVHNRYRSALPSGENRVVDDEIGRLRAAGVDVATYLRSSDEITGMSAARRAAVAAGPLYARRAVSDVAEILETRRPDVVHLHNPFPLISPWVVRVAVDRGIPVVQTVHNYRHGCVRGTLFRDGRPCEDCVGRQVGWPGALHGCYRGSRLQSLPMVAAQAAHRPTWRQVHRFLALTTFMRDKLVAVGLPADRIEVRPNSVADPGPPGPRGAGILYLGRLDAEKGVDLLLDAWRLLAVGEAGQLRIAGEGPLLPAVAALAAHRDDVDVMGGVTPGDAMNLIGAAAVVVIPSRCYEGLPLVALEAMARGRPVLTTDVGALPSVVDAGGWSVSANPESLAAGLRAVAAGDGWERKARAARSRYERFYSPRIVLQQLIDVYGRAVSANGPGR